MVRRGARGARAATGAVAAVTALLAPSAPAVAAAQAPATLRIVVFDGPGTAGYRGPLSVPERRREMERRQGAALSAVDAPDPVYRWTTALNGVAVPLTDAQAIDLHAQPGVSLIEENSVLRLAATGSAGRSLPATGRHRGGAGVVVGFVDTGIWPESPLFAASPGVAPRPARFASRCVDGEQWSPTACQDKLVAADWFVSGFDKDRLGSHEVLSPRDALGHGTQMASIAAGDAGVSLDTPGLRGTFAGVAPRAGVAAYKACWGAPDPRDDGCATADVVAAIDRATRDRVDVLNLSVEGSPGIDAVERALLGAAEAGIVVVAAADNGGADAWSTHESPWVTTVGGLTSTAHGGTVGFGQGRRLTGVMTAEQPVRAPAVRAQDIPAPGSSAASAALCVPGSLDAARAEGRIVVCERGVIGRVEKSAAVARADGVGMVLVNVRRGSLGHDLHAVPTVHLSEAPGRVLSRWVAGHPRGVVTLAPGQDPSGSRRVASWSSGGAPAGGFVKPDLVAPGTGLLGAVPPSTAAGGRWAFASGTSAATAWASGAAASVSGRHPDWSAAQVRSVLATSAAPVGASPLRQGAGLPRVRAALRTRLAYDVAPRHYRAWLRGRRTDVNTPSLLVQAGDRVTRRVTNLGRHTGTWTVSVSGFERYDVQVAPTTLRPGPGRTAAYRVAIGTGTAAGGLDAGRITWHGPGGDVSIPVAIGR